MHLIWGCGEFGSWDHCAWLCASRPVQRRPPARPSLELCWRLGWSVEGLDSKVQPWLEKVQRRVWDVRHSAHIPEFEAAE